MRTADTANRPNVTLDQADVAEVKRRTEAFAEELMAVGTLGFVLARRAAVHSVRMERLVDQQDAANSIRVRRVEAEFVPPEGASPAEAARLRAEAVQMALFDPSPEATLARRAEIVAERGFYRALKELRTMERESEALLKADEDARVEEKLASFLAMSRAGEAMEARLGLPPIGPPSRFAQAPSSNSRVDVPMSIGRGR